MSSEPSVGASSLSNAPAGSGSDPSAASAPPESPGARVNLPRFEQYSLVARLGSGGMAEVFLALEEGMAGVQKPVVVKMIYPHLTSNVELSEMFFDEARLATQLRHPNVVHTYRVGTAHGRHFLTMEYLEGVPVDQLQRDELVPLAPPLAALIASEILDGLHYAHEARALDGQPFGLVHRDVSPQNLFLTFNGEVKLLDFGVAKAATARVLTATGIIKGKHAYMAPEQAQGLHLDRRTDVWAMGVVLWELLTGQRLFRGENDLATLQRVVSMDIPAVTSAGSEVPPALAAIVHRALQRDRNQRFGSAAEMRSELESWLRSLHRPPSRRTLSEYLERHYGHHRENLVSLVRQGVAAVRADADPYGATQLGRAMNEVSPNGMSALEGDADRERAREASERTSVEPVAPRRRGLFWIGLAMGALLLFAFLWAGSSAAVWFAAGEGAGALLTDDGLSTVETLPPAVNPHEVQPEGVTAPNIPLQPAAVQVEPPSLSTAAPAPEPRRRRRLGRRRRRR